MAEVSQSLPQLRVQQVLLAVIGIYVSQTVITTLATQALPSVLRDAGASLQTTGLSALLWIPWGVRFLWSARVERWRLPANQLKRRSKLLILSGQWLIASILLMQGLLSLSGFLSLTSHVGWILGGLFVAACVASTTDIASDAFAVEQLNKQQHGWGNVAQVGGGYFGAMLGAGGFLLMVNMAGWAWALIATALVIVLLSLPMLLIQEPSRSCVLMVADHQHSIRNALHRPEVSQSLLLLMLASLGIRLTLGLFGPFMLDRGMTLEQLGWLFGFLPISAGLSGAVLAGLLVHFAPGWHAVWLSVGLKACVLSVLTIIASTASLTTLIVLISLMFAALGFVWVALYSALMSMTSPLQPGVDFALYQSADALLAMFSGVLGGILAQHLGYESCFGLAAISSVLAVVVIRHKAPALEHIAFKRNQYA